MGPRGWQELRTAARACGQCCEMVYGGVEGGAEAQHGDEERLSGHKGTLRRGRGHALEVAT